MTLTLNLLVYSEVMNAVLCRSRLFLPFHHSLTNTSTCIHSHIHKNKKKTRLHSSSDRKYISQINNMNFLIIFICFNKKLSRKGYHWIDTSPILVG